MGQEKLVCPFDHGNQLASITCTVDISFPVAAFPGGKQDETDKGPLECCLVSNFLLFFERFLYSLVILQRESDEEIGLKATDVRIIARLDPLVGRNELLVTPYVGIISDDFEPVVNLDEVAEVFKIPFDQFLPETGPAPFHKFHFIDDEGIPRAVSSFHIDAHVIFGLPAEFLLQFLKESQVRPAPAAWTYPEQAQWFQYSLTLNSKL